MSFEYFFKAIIFNVGRVFILLDFFIDMIEKSISILLARLEEHLFE